uniref:Uncharacterized protein n=1 Tax=Arundo donax TaxID=35708 RepID=A0A0A9E328_ARUDO
MWWNTIRTLKQPFFTVVCGVQAMCQAMQRGCALCPSLDKYPMDLFIECLCIINRIPVSILVNDFTNLFYHIVPLFIYQMQHWFVCVSFPKQFHNWICEIDKEINSFPPLIINKQHFDLPCLLCIIF